MSLQMKRPQKQISVDVPLSVALNGNYIQPLLVSSFKEYFSSHKK